ncbi:FAD-dependent oxidoreductase, partial [bacterium LRH843]|nr:FAD-dependent oxidoreductase [bacterium LRH843]
EYPKPRPKVNFHEQAWVHTFDIVNQQVQGIKTADGQSYHADHVVIATGAWSQHWSEQLQCSIPVNPVQGQMLLFKTPENWLPTMCMNQVMYLIPRLDGHIVCGSSM